MAIAHKTFNRELMGPASQASDISCQLLPVCPLGYRIKRDFVAFDHAVGVRLNVLVAAANSEFARAAA